METNLTTTRPDDDIVLFVIHLGDPLKPRQDMMLYKCYNLKDLQEFLNASKRNDHLPFPDMDKILPNDLARIRNNNLVP